MDMFEFKLTKKKSAINVARRLTCASLALVVCVSLAACGGNSNASVNSGNADSVEQSVAVQDENKITENTSKAVGNLDAAQSDGGETQTQAEQTESSSEAESSEAQEIVSQSVEVVTQPPHTVHSYNLTKVAATCEENGKNVYRCSVCGDSYEEEDADSPALGHDYTSNEIVVTATQYSPGTRRFICGVCGATKDLAYGYAHTVRAYDGTHVVYGYWDTACEQEIFDLLNEYRVSQGLKALTKSSTISETAHQRALEIAYSYRHNHSRPTNERWRTAYPEDDFCGENIASGQADAQEVTTGWIESPDHEENMSSTMYHHVGIGVFVRVDCPESGEVTVPDPNGLSHEDYRYYVQSFSS
jgi:uncharacterized protein YkwD